MGAESGSSHAEGDALGAELERLHVDAEELRASRERLVHAADSDRHRLERELHDGLQQHLVALAVNLQLAEPLAGSDPAAAALIVEMRNDVDEALAEAARLAQRLHAPLDLGGLAVALRAAAVSAGTSATVDVSVASSYRAEIARTVYLCWLEALDMASGEEPAIRVREKDGRVAFELTAATRAQAGLERLRDRVEALGGSLRIDTAPTRGLQVLGSLPV